jgi:hypothetical protein
VKQPGQWFNRSNRRAFLRGVGGAALALPFLEGVPERSAWAQGEEPRFIFFIVAACGVVADSFFPGAKGALTSASLAGEGKATSALADHAANMLFVDGVSYPGRLSNCGHAQGLVQSLTGVGPQGGGSTTQSTGISADMVLGREINPAGVDPLTLYAGAKEYIAERISFSGAGNARPAERNPFNVYRNLVGLVGEGNGGGGGGNPDGEAAVNELVTRELSINDFIRDDLESLLARSDLSAADRQRLDAHLTAVRELEMGMTQVATVGCEMAGVNVSAIQAMENLRYSKNGHMIEDLVKLHSELVALTFACNVNRVATLQWGDGTDGTVYEVPNNSRQWKFHHISHRVQSDATSGNDQTAVVAHREIDVLRMQTFKHTLDQFAARGLFDKAAVVWTNHVSDGPSHSFSNLPFIIGGSLGGVLKQGEYVSGGNTSNADLLTTLIRATGGSGSVGNGGTMNAILA